LTAGKRAHLEKLYLATRQAEVPVLFPPLGLDCQIQACPPDLAITTVAVQADGSD